MAADNPTHQWRFFRAGGFDQVRIDSGADVVALPTLDQKLWVALACPTRGIEFDEKTLDIIDTDHDGRIRAPEILAAAAWVATRLKDPEDLTLGRATLPLAAIDSQTPEGAALIASARTMLGMLGKPDQDEVSLEDTADIEHLFEGSIFNGDGVVTSDAAESAAIKSGIDVIVQVIGPVTDRSGKPGVSQETSDKFFAEAASFAAWHAERSSQVLGPLGEDAAEAAVLLHALGPKIDDYFTRSRLASFDPGALDGLNPDPALYAGFAGATLDEGMAEIASLPLAHIGFGPSLPLSGAINPAWSAQLAKFRAEIAVPLLGPRDELELAQWERLKKDFTDWQAWVGREPDTAVKTLGLARIDALLDPTVKAEIDALIARDAALAPEIDAIVEVEKLVRLQRDLFPLLNNIVAFRDFYRRTGKAVFQAGTLYLDGRSLDLCVKIEDEAKHAQLAVLSGIYLAYCRCTRPGKTMLIAAALTAGSSDNIRVGRNGLFYDRKGNDWDATIVKIVEHPISLREAFWLPYKQAARAISDAIQKFAAARQVTFKEDQITKAVTTATAEPAPKAPPPPPPQPFDMAKYAGIFAALGLAVGALATALASILTGFLRLAAWQMPLVLVGIMLLISGPAVIIAAIKLAGRNLGPILDACGWAVNTRLRINIPFGTALTALARLPPGAQRSLNDPYAEKQTPWGLWLFLIVLIVALAAGWHFGFLAGLTERFYR